MKKEKEEKEEKKDKKEKQFAKLENRLSELREQNEQLKKQVEENEQLNKQIRDLQLKLREVNAVEAVSGEEEKTNSGKKRKKKGDDDNPRKKRISLEKAISPPQRDIPAIPNDTMRLLTRLKTIKRKPLNIHWDHQNVGASKEWKTVNLLLLNLRKNFRRLGFELRKIHIYDIGFPRKFWLDPNSSQSVENIPQCRYEEIRIDNDLVLIKHWVVDTKSKREDVDVDIMVDVMKYSLSKEPPVSVTVVAGDSDYLMLIERLRTKGIDAYISCNYSCPHTTQDIKEKDYFLDWGFLTKNHVATRWYPPLQQLGSPLPRVLPPSTDDENFSSMIALWQIDTPSVPFTTTVGELLSRVKNFVQNHGHVLHSLNCYYEDNSNPDPDPDPVVEKTKAKARKEIKELVVDLNSTDGIKVNRVVYPIAKTAGQRRDPEMDYLDVKIAKEIYIWTLTKMPPAPMLLISSDIRLASVVKDLRAAGFKVLVATDKKNREAWDAFNASGANCVFDWV